MGYVQVPLHGTVCAQCSSIFDVSVGVMTNLPVHHTPRLQKIVVCLFLDCVSIGYWLRSPPSTFHHMLLNPDLP